MNALPNNVIGLLRIALGWIFLWPFLDKMYGLGFATEAGKGWVDGGSPTTGFLKFAAAGPFAEFYQSLAGQAWVDWLFMIGLLLIGVSLLFGIMMRLAVGSGVIMLLLMYTAVLPPEHNPVIDDHIVYSLALLLLLLSNAGEHLGFGQRWKQLDVVKENRFLQ